MKHPNLKDWLMAFIQKFAYVSMFYIIVLLATRNGITEGFKENLWILLIGSLVIVAVDFYIKPILKNKIKS